MSVKWIKDVDSGELFPIVDEEADFDIPEHLKVSEHTFVDYEETTKNTIADLQEQLTAAQEQIDVYKNVQAVELQETADVQGTLTEKPKHFAIDKSCVLFIVACVLASLLGVFCVKRLSDDGYRFSMTVAQQEVAEADEETEESEDVSENFLPLLRGGLSVLFITFGVRTAINIMKGTLSKL